MNSLLIVVLAAACACAALGAPEQSALQQAKAEAARKKACMQSCARAALEPLCAGKAGEKPKSFGNACVLQNHNCEHKDNWTKISAGQCPGSEGIRLS